jgi:sulfur-oxidizing protein SoxY
MQKPTIQRRGFLSLLLGSTLCLLLQPLTALAALWNKAAFEADRLNAVSKILTIEDAVASTDIQIIAPDRAENGAVVQVEINSNIANTDLIYILVENNPTPLIAQFAFSNGAQPYVVTRIKMAESADIKVVVKAGKQFFSHSKHVVVLENGCG